MGDLIQRVQDSVRSQKSSFCSRATRVTVIGDTINTDDIVTYVDCEGRRNEATYREIFTNNGYINNCVQGGSPIISTGGDTRIPNRYFVQFGTTDCNTPPPSGDNVLLTPCGEVISLGIPVDITGYELKQGDVYQIQLNPINPFGAQPPLQCYTVGGQTNQQASYNITGQVENVGDCNMCKTPEPTRIPTFFSYIVGDTSYDSQLNACGSLDGGTITVYSDTKELIVDSTFLYGDQQLKTSYYTKGFVLHSGKGKYVISTGPDGKLKSLDPCS